MVRVAPMWLPVSESAKVCFGVQNKRLKSDTEPQTDERCCDC